jgi:hypothetical protein
MSPPPDAAAPSVPQSLTVTPSSATRIDLAWRPSTDNVGVTAYRAYRDGSLFRSTIQAAAFDTARLPGDRHCYAVSALDAAVNESPRTAEACATTTGILLAPTVNVSRSAISSFGHFFTVLDPSRIHAVWQEGGNNITYSRSADGGLTFSAPRPLTDPQHQASQPRLLGAQGVVHLAWVAYNGPTDTNGIHYAHSSDDGTSFSPRRRLSSDYSSSPTSPGLAARADTVAVVWADSRLGTPDSSGVRLRMSGDGGVTFSSERFLSGQPLCTVAAISGRHVYVAWAEEPIDHQRIYVAVSGDGGATFAAPIEVDQSADQLLCPVMAIDNVGQALIAWEERTGTQGRIMFAHSANDGASFSEPVPLSALNVNAYCPFVTTLEGATWISWSNLTPVGSGRQTWLVFSTDGGVTRSSPVQIPYPVGSAGCFQLLQLRRHDLGLGWTVGGSTPAEVYFNRLRVAVP